MQQMAGTYSDPAIAGGGQIYAQVCHVAAYLAFLNGTPPSEVFARFHKDGCRLEVEAGRQAGAPASASTPCVGGESRPMSDKAQPEPGEKRGRVPLKACGDKLLCQIVLLEIDLHENQPWRKCYISFSQALAFPCLRRGVVHLIDTDLKSAIGIPESEGVESGAKDDDLPNPSFDNS
jgi:hypothetical protein